MKRAIFVALAFLVGCNGIGSGTNRFVPGGPDATESAAGSMGRPVANARRGRTKVRLTLTIPRRRRHDRVDARHPSTISPLTQSVSIAVDGGAPSVFNATPSSAGCKIGASGTVCTFALVAPIGSDTFVVSTYSGASGGGTMLDRGTAVVAIATGKANTPSIVLGPVVSTTADSGIGSLRYAIGSANAGDTIMLMLAAGSTITVTSAPLTISNRISIAGPGVSTSARRRGGRHASATYTGVALSGGNALQIFVVQAGAIARISGLILTGGKAAVANQPGGAVTNQGTLTLANDVFTSNSSIVQSPFVRRARPHAVRGRGVSENRRSHAPCTTAFNEGGAVYNDGTLEVSGTTFDGNAVTNNFFGAGNCTYGRGGAIYNDQNGTLVSSGNTYENGSAYEGGAVFNESQFGQASFADDVFTGNTGCTSTTGCPGAGCTASSCSSYATGRGGAIYDDAGPGINISGSTFESNAVGDSPGGQGQGGALYLNTVTTSVTGSTFRSNASGGGTASCSQGIGGAIEDQAQILEIDDDTFASNQATGDELGQGGAIDTAATLQGSGDTFTSNAASGFGSTCPTTGTAFGGAIDGSSSVMLASSTFSSDVVTGAGNSDGGAIDCSATAKLTGDTFTSNSAIVTSAAGATGGTGQGGAVDTNFLALSSSAFTSNTAGVTGAGTQAEGGAIYSGNTAGSTGDTFTANAAAGGSTEGAGGAFYNEGTLASSGDTFKSNTATGLQDANGGAIYDESGLFANGDTFVSNSTTSDQAWGGAIYANNVGSSVANSTFTSNAANALTGQTGLGGAIYDDQGFSLNGSTVSGNTATSGGGGLYLSATDSIANSTISANQVSHATIGIGGGGVLNTSGLTIANSTIAGNTVTVTGASAGGGGIMTADTLSMTGSTVSGNQVLGSPSGVGLNADGGGGILNGNGSDVTITNSTIDANSSVANGGGIENEGSSAELTNVTLFQNSATANGGNIDNEGALDLANGIVAGGLAPNGPDISNPGTLTSQDYNLIQTTVIGNALAGATTHDLQVAPLLLALANNGGATLTNAEQASSPTVAHIPFAGGNCGGVSNGFDQRGFARGAGAVCDIGAFELGGTPTAARPSPPVVHGHRHQAKKKRPALGSE